MKLFLIKAQTACALGVGNLMRALSYRIGVRVGFNPVRRLQAEVPSGPFFGEALGEKNGLPYPAQWNSELRYFGLWPCPLSEAPPDWHLNPLSGVRVPMFEQEWWRIPDFDAAVGDIKNIWEASRFDWVLSFTQKACSDDSAALLRLNLWLSDWSVKNPPYRGPNWKCGQEASIRVLHLAMAAVMLDQVDTSLKGLLDLVSVHLTRIEPTLSYAMAQDNNHGTSEAAALFVGGSWLSKYGVARGEHWQRLGRKWLENRAARLIELDGSFSQYSVNYHRVLLDTFSMVEIWRIKLGLDSFSTNFQSRARAAGHWLATLVDAVTGDAPNIGANDGARLLPLTNTAYRDFRPSVQLFTVLFFKRRAYSARGDWDLPLKWLKLDIPEGTVAPPSSKLFNSGGYAVLIRERTLAVLRYPRFRFRPSQADALHVDLWRNGRNLLGDAGTYSYNTSADWLSYFPGTASHNTLQFDGRDQMPRLSRFLFGNWLRTQEVEPLVHQPELSACGATYLDREGITHQRHICLTETHLTVSDKFRGFVKKAVLRWRLQPGNWVIEGLSLTNGSQRLLITGSMPVLRFELVQGWESLYYLQKTEIPVLEVEVDTAGILTTEYHW